MLKRIITYNVNAHLKTENGYTYFAEFNVSAKNSDDAESLVEKYLTENKDDNLWKYESVIGVRTVDTSDLIVDISEEDLSIVKINEEQIINIEDIITIKSLMEKYKDRLDIQNFIIYNSSLGYDAKTIDDMVERVKIVLKNINKISLVESDFNEILKILNSFEKLY